MVGERDEDDCASLMLQKSRQNIRTERGGTPYCDTEGKKCKSLCLENSARLQQTCFFHSSTSDANVYKYNKPVSSTLRLAMQNENMNCSKAQQEHLPPTNSTTSSAIDVFRFFKFISAACACFSLFPHFLPDESTWTTTRSMLMYRTGSAHIQHDARAGAAQHPVSTLIAPISVRCLFKRNAAAISNRSTILLHV